MRYHVSRHRLLIGKPMIATLLPAVRPGLSATSGTGAAAGVIVPRSGIGAEFCPFLRTDDAYARISA
jgi:hypothetical protein